MASDFFLKFDDSHKSESFEDAAEHAAHDLRHLGHASVDLGGGFLKLIRDGSVSPDSPSAATVDLKFKRDDAIISSDLFKLGSDFVSASDSQHKIDIKEIPVIKVLDQSTPHFSKLGGVPATDTDLVKYETDLNATGTSFLNIPSDLAGLTPGGLRVEFNIISLDYGQQSTDLLNIGNDFTTLATSPVDQKVHGLSNSLQNYGEGALALANDYKILSADFEKVAVDFAPQVKGFGGGLTFNQAVVQDSGDFIKLADDLKLANADYKMFAGETIKLSDTLESAAQQLLPAVQKT